MAGSAGFHFSIWCAVTRGMYYIWTYFAIHGCPKSWAGSWLLSFIWARVSLCWKPWKITQSDSTNLFKPVELQFIQMTMTYTSARTHTLTHTHSHWHWMKKKNSFMKIRTSNRRIFCSSSNVSCILGIPEIQLICLDHRDGPRGIE